MKRNHIGVSSRAMRARTGSSRPKKGTSKYARKFLSGNSMYCKRNQRGDDKPDDNQAEA